MATVYERLKKILIKKLGVKEEEITPSASFAKLKVLSIVQLALPSWIRTFGLIEHLAILFI